MGSAAWRGTGPPGWGWRRSPPRGRSKAGCAGTSSGGEARRALAVCCGGVARPCRVARCVAADHDQHGRHLPAERAAHPLPGGRRPHRVRQRQRPGARAAHGLLPGPLEPRRGRQHLAAGLGVEHRALRFRHGGRGSGRARAPRPGRGLARGRHPGLRDRRRARALRPRPAGRGRLHHAARPGPGLAGRRSRRRGRLGRRRGARGPGRGRRPGHHRGRALVGSARERRGCAAAQGCQGAAGPGAQHPRGQGRHGEPAARHARRRRRGPGLRADLQPRHVALPEQPAGLHERAAARPAEHGQGAPRLRGGRVEPGRLGRQRRRLTARGQRHGRPGHRRGRLPRPVPRLPAVARLPWHRRRRHAVDDACVVRRPEVRRPARQR